MTHAFLLFVFLGVGEEKKLVSNDLYFKDLNECVWYAQIIHKQGSQITSYCLPKLVNPDKVRLY
jgi:hypothetical protein